MILNCIRLLRRAKWRKGPATESQKAMLIKKYKSQQHSAGKALEMDKLTKGQAADMITRLKHGAHVSMMCTLAISRQI